MPKVRKFLAELGIRNACSMRQYCFVNQLNCCDVRNVDADADDGDGDGDDDDDDDDML
jgi:hypothetical protein